jgi:hypothetical protein
MSERSNSARNRHPLFNAMVLMGGGLALHCGGNVNHQTEASGGDSSAGVTGSGGQAGGGSGFGGALVLGSGGAPVTAGPFDCPPEQWDCSATMVECIDMYRLPEKCECDRSRPLTSADCDGMDWVCRRAPYDSSGRTLTTPVDFECGCVPHQQSCNEACEKLYGFPAHCQDRTPDTNAVICECAYIVLR